MKSESQHHKSSWKKGLVVVAAVFVIIIGVACIFDSLAVNELGRAMNAARAIGGPVTLQELMAARRQWPDDKNGANVILAIQAQLDAVSKSDKAGILPGLSFKSETELGRRWSDTTDHQVRELLDSTQKEVAAIDMLKGYEGGSFPLTLDPCPISILLPHLAPLRTACHLKHLQVLERAMVNDTTRLVDDVTVMLRIADLVSDEPVLVSMLVGVACDAAALGAVEEVCGLTSVKPDALRQLQDMAGRMDGGHRRIALGMRGERAIFIGTTDYVRMAATNAKANLFGFPTPGGLAFGPMTKLPGARGVLMRDEAVGIALHNRLVAAAEQSRLLAEARAVDLEIPKLGATSFLTRTLFSTFTRAIILDQQLNAEALCAEVALAAERFRLDTGKFPVRLDELAPKYIDRIPADPFKPAEPLKVHADTTRFIVYSVGVDELDNGGDVRRDKKQAGDSPDYGFILLAPGARNQPPLPSETQPEDGDRPAASSPSSGVLQRG